MSTTYPPPRSSMRLPPSALLHVKHAALQLGVGTGRFVSAIKSGEIPIEMVKLAGARYVRREGFERWLAGAGVQQ